MKIVLFHAIMVLSCFINIHGYLSREPQDPRSGQLELFASFNRQDLSRRYTIPSSIQIGDRLALNVRNAIIQNSPLATFGQSVAWEVVSHEGTGEVELKIKGASPGSTWKMRVNYLLIKKLYLQSGLFMETLTITALASTTQLRNSMAVILHESNEMNGKDKIAPRKKQILLLSTGLALKMRQIQPLQTIRAIGYITDETNIHLHVGFKGIQTYILTILIIDKQVFSPLDLKIETTYQYFPNLVQGQFDSTNILNEIQIRETCEQPTQKDCWSMRALNIFQIRQSEKSQSKQLIPEKDLEYSQRNLGFCLWGTAPCTCTVAHAVTCFKDLFCNNCWTASCAAGYYQPWFTNSCNLCPVIPNCNGCHIQYGKSSASCATCNGGYTSIGGNCISCPVGCSGCTTVSVSGVEKASCSGCSPTLTATTVGSVTTCGCLSNQYLSGSTCSSCPPTCTSCTSATTCTGCPAGRYLSSPSCLTCMPVCKTCSAGATCDSCSNTLFALTAGVCVCKSPYLFDATTKTCLLCSAFKTNCAACGYATAYSPSSPPAVVCVTANPGYYVNANGTAAACILYCTNCTSNHLLCETPNTGFTFDGNSSSCICTAGLYFASGSCSTCSSVIKGCSSCQTNPIPNATVCVTCNTLGYFNSTPYPVSSCSACAALCQTCNSLSDCTLCVNNLIPNAGICTCDSNSSLYYDSVSKSCLACSNVFFNCQSCASNGSTSVMCTSCGPGKFVSSSGMQCSYCPITCTSCLNASYCTACQPGYDAVNNTCVCGTSCKDCMTNSTDGFCSSCTFSSFVCNGCITGYLLNANGTCSSCNSTFSGCAECTTTTCMSCIPPFILTPAGCVCNNTAGLYLSIDSSTCAICSLAIPNCLTCVGNNGSATNCTAAAAGFFIDVGGQSCASCSGFCLTCVTSATTCDSCLATFITVSPNVCGCDNNNDYYYNPATQGCSLCASIISNCLSCSTSVLITSCNLCSGGYWDSGSSACVQCPSSCVHCSSATVCTSCPATFVLSETLPGWTVAGVCVCDTTSSIAPYYDALSKTCQACSYFYPSCTTCAGGNLAICSICGDGTYLVNGSCTNCPSTCATCSSATTCTSCPGSLTLSGGVCICDAACSECQLLSIGCVSCTITAGAITACLACEPGLYLASPSCLSCPPACATCTGPSSCLTCQPSYVLSAGACSCATSLGIFPNSAGTCVPCAQIIYGCLDCSVATGSTTCDIPAQGYFVSGSQCLACSATCLSCTGTASGCTDCTIGLTLVNGTCTCSDVACLACNATSPNCAQCVYTIAGSFSSCASCQPGFFLSGTSCTRCPSDCVTCGAGGACLTCPNIFQVIAGSCDCNNALAMWESAGKCITCTTLYPNCQTCIQNISTLLNVSCAACLYGYYARNSTCAISVCGDGLITSGENCDDGNSLSHDGCSQYCLAEDNFVCVGQPSVCTMNLNYHITLGTILADPIICNQLTISFSLDPVYSSYDSANFRNMFSYVSSANLEYKSWNYRVGVVTYTFSHTATLNNQTVMFYFAPKNLGLNDTKTVPVITVSALLLSQNNLAIVYYPAPDCESKASMRGLATAVKYASYGVLATSAFPCKIVGLELFGVLQLAYLSTGNMDNVNTMLTPLMEMKGVQGFAMDMGKESKKRQLQGGLTPSRVQSIGYEANFLRNCNVMLAIVVVIIAVAFALYAFTFCCRKCAPSLHSFARRMFKEVLLTLILFNCFNFAYSAGIHFAYAPTDDSLYRAGTAAAVLALVLPVLMAFGIMCAEDTGFGEFKEKFKPGVVERLYFVVTILYRSGIGLYVSTMNEDSLSTLVVMALAIAFLLYNLVNLPYARAYHNYRANVCHFAQAICLFVAMYYRSMMSSADPTEIASNYGPAYLQMGAILVSLIVSLLVLVYEVYLFVKQCLTSNSEAKPEKVMITENNENSKANLDEKQNTHNFSIDFVEVE